MNSLKSLRAIRSHLITATDALEDALFIAEAEKIEDRTISILEDAQADIDHFRSKLDKMLREKKAGVDPSPKQPKETKT